MTLDRRTLFSSAAAAAGFAAMPDWLAFFAGQDPKPTPAAPSAREQQLRSAAAQAKAQGKPLLVFVVPDDERAAYTRGEWLGAWLVQGGSRARLDAALCVPAAATLQEVRALGRVQVSDPAPVMLLLDAAPIGDPAAPLITATPVEIALPAKAGPERVGDLERLTLALATALPRHSGALDVMARRVRAALATEDRQRLDAWIAGGPLPADDLLVRAAACLRCAGAGMDAEHSQATEAALLAAIDRVLIQRPLPGARWGRTEGCGVDIEDPDAPDGLIGAGFECGMGRVPAAARRFLVFYTGS